MNRMLCWCLAGWFPLLAGVAPARAADGVKAVVKKAIEAHGGAANLTRFSISAEKSRGTLTVGGKDLEFEAETIVQLPAKFRNTLKMTVDGRATTQVQILNGDQGWQILDGTAQPFDEAKLSEVRDALYAHQVAQLTELLTNKRYTLTPVADQVIKGKPAVGVEVSADGRPTVTLFMDKESGLLVKLSRTVAEQGRERKHDELYSEYKEYDGLQRPARVVLQRDGKKFVTITVLEYKGLTRVDETTFARP